MTEEQVMILVDRAKADNLNDYRTIKNKLMAGIKVPINEISHEYFYSDNTQVDLVIGGTLEELRESLTAVDTSVGSSPGNILIESGEQLEAQGFDGDVEELYFDVYRYYLRETESDIDFHKNNSELWRIIKEDSGISSSGRYIIRNVINERLFMSGGMSYEELMQPVRAGAERLNAETTARATSSSRGSMYSDLWDSMNLDRVYTRD